MIKVESPTARHCIMNAMYYVVENHDVIIDSGSLGCQDCVKIPDHDPKLRLEAWVVVKALST